MIKEALLGLLADKPMHGYDLKLALDRMMGRTTPVNVGQVYTALNKLEKDGLVYTEYVARDDRADMKIFHLAPKGEEELGRWFGQPVEKMVLRDELFLKLSLARRSGKADVDVIIRAQRSANLEAIQELTRMAAQHEESDDPEIGLLIEGAILRLEADLQWLELWQKRTTR